MTIRYDSTNPIGASLVLAHGAGAGQQSPFITRFANALASLGIDVVTFNFPYMEERRKVPDRGPVLEASYREIVEAVWRDMDTSHHRLFIGGKSMGGRIATQIVAGDTESPVAGLVLLGYPLHPPGRPDQRRDRHLANIRRPMLFVQGSRDVFGTPAELSPVLSALTPAPTLHVVEGGDHSFKVTAAKADVQNAIYDELPKVIARWIQSVGTTSHHEVTKDTKLS